MLKNENTVFHIASETEFLSTALEIFQFQYQNNPIYKEWVSLLNVKPHNVKTLEQIPFLPIEFFKQQKVVSSPITADTVCFTSSATTSQIPSKHYVNNISLYRQSFLTAFRKFYGQPEDYCILALLPNYLQRGGSSLVYMCHELITRSGHPFSGFFLNNLDELTARVHELKKSSQKVLLIGVSYALLDLCDKELALNENFIVMETGGMKGTRKELLKPELHAYLKKGFQINTIHSEYGMTELLSQAYSKQDGLFQSPPWMRCLTREVNDPMQIRKDYKTGGINVIDLANIHSCSFIATQDLGRIHPDNSFELMGRYDNSDVRGCNLMLGEF